MRDVGVLLTRVKCHLTVVGHHSTAVIRCGTCVEVRFTRSTWNCAHVMHNCTEIRSQERPKTPPENGKRRICEYRRGDGKALRGVQREGGGAGVGDGAHRVSQCRRGWVRCRGVPQSPGIHVAVVDPTASAAPSRALCAASRSGCNWKVVLTSRESCGVTTYKVSTSLGSTTSDDRWGAAVVYPMLCACGQIP